MPDMINLANDDAAGLLRFALEPLRRYEAREVIDGIDESRRLGIEEGVSKEEVGRRNVGMVRRRPPTDVEILRIVFERLHQRASITASATFGHSASPDNVTWWHIMARQGAMQVYVKYLDNFCHHNSLYFHHL